MLLRSLRRYELHHDEQGEQEMCPSASLVNQFELEFYSGPDSWTAVPDPIGNPGRLESLCVRLPPLYHAASLNPPSCEPIPKWYQLAGVA